MCIHEGSAIGKDTTNNSSRSLRFSLGAIDGKKQKEGRQFEDDFQIQQWPDLSAFPGEW